MTHEEFRSRIRVSSEAAHKELFEEYCNYVYTIVYNRLRSCMSRADIEECVCDVFADVYIYYDDSKDITGDISGFIGTIARRKAGELYKRSALRTESIPIDDEEISGIGSDQNIVEEAEKNECRRMILDNIRALGEPDSTIIIQKYYYGCSAKEIADMVSLAPENVRVRSGRAVKRLREMLEKAGISL
ncbi:MAG: sigma-70 family RNA polymerase sigma factor [Ruminococcus sp.]|nr:sigma-70 family RNA polymerase sigma factor [Ruminococcus sp.]